MIFVNIRDILYSRFKMIFYKILYGSRLQVGKAVGFRRKFNIIIDGGQVTIGNNVFFNFDCTINCLGNVHIGDNCRFGENVKIYDHNHKFKDINKPIPEQGMSIGKVTIGNNCWIGTNTVILKDVSVGDNVVIGAGCVIFKSIPSNHIVKNNNQLSVSLIEKQ
jgi:acetyltransferase-like isoleucine patch superfamily enzyme